MTRARLTPRMYELVFLRCVSGYSRDEAADQMGISVNKARDYVSQVMRRTGLRTWDQVCFHYGRTTMAEQHGLIGGE